MYLHLGQDTVIKMDEIVGIFNMETSTISKTTRNYLAQAEKAGKVVNVSMELPALRETGQLVPRMGSENTGGIPLREMRRMLERRAG